MNQPVSPRLIDRLRSLRTLWRDIAGSSREVPTVRPDLPPDDADSLREQLRACLVGKGGEVSARARAAALGRNYLGLSAEGRARFLGILADEFDTDAEAVDAAMARVVAATARGDRQAAERELRQALEAPRVRLLTQFNALPEGVKFLVDMRAELIRLARQDARLQGLEGDLKALLAGWFDVGFLELRRITWRSPALLLEKIIAYEAVHAIRGWEDLKNRLDSDRRLYAFFHPRMPDEPLIFVEVALVRGMAGNVHDLLDVAAPVGDPTRADTAIFYSISSAQKGLAGISFGNFLIKRVVDSLAGEFPNLRTFATLSPIPGFMDWLRDKLNRGEPGLLTAMEHRAVAEIAGGGGAKGSLKAWLAGGDWHLNQDIAEALKGPLMRLCTRYLAVEKRPDGRALDPVAHFHLSNGARMERLNWMADTSPKGLRESAAMMMNFLYKLDDIEANHEAYSGQGKITMSSAMRALLKG
ncbi:MAG: malonyl-CoA decarboxylase [Rhodospirillales bacterium]|nr:malonyl-CoA decarboxylase [Rhodospirillales bacterium]